MRIHRQRGDGAGKAAYGDFAVLRRSVGKDADAPPAQNADHAFGGDRSRCCRWHGDQVALAAGDAEVAHGEAVGLAFDAFGDDACRAGFGEGLHGFDELEFEVVVGNAADEVAVDLDVLGLHF